MGESPFSSPLLVCADPDSMDFQRDCVAVRLETDWRSMLDALPDFGRVLTMTSGGGCVLGRFDEYPRLRYHHKLPLAADATSSFDFDFSVWRSARAAHSKTDGGNVFAIEFFDPSGNVLHKVCLTPDSDLNAYLGFVEEFQAQGWETEIEGTMSPVVPVQSAPAKGAHLSVAGAALPALFDRFATEGRPLRAIAGNDGAVQGHEFTPRSLRGLTRGLFLSDEQTGIHWEPSLETTAMLHNLGAIDQPLWTLKIYNPCGRLSLAISPPENEPLDEWNAFLLKNTITT